MVYDLLSSEQEEDMHDLWFEVKNLVLVVGMGMDYSINQKLGSYINSMYDLNNPVLDSVWQPLNARSAGVQRAMEIDMELDT